MLNTLQTYLDIIINYLESIGPIGGFFLVLLESVLPVMPLAVFIGFNCLAYGDISGFFISWFATIVGCMLSFTLFRFVLKNFFYKLFKEKTRIKIEKIMSKMSKIDFNALVVLLAMPFTPAFLVNIAAGLSNISWKKYFVALLIGKLSIIYFWGYVGSNLLEGFTNPMVILKMLLLVLGAYLISKVIEKIFKVEE